MTPSEDEEENDLVLDFSSGKPKMVEDTATKVGVNDLLEEAGNVTIFSPVNDAFDKLPVKVEDVPLSTVRRWILKHFVKGFLFRRDMVNGPLQTLGGEFVTVTKDSETNKVRIFSLSGAAEVKVANIKTKFNLVHVLDTVLT